MGLVIGAMGPPTAQADFNAALDFSTTMNPNGVWSYGQEASLSGPLTLFTTHGTSTGNASGPGTIDILTVSGFNQQAALFHNGTTQNYQGGDPGTGIGPGVLAIEAGTAAYGVTRFTAITAGLYTINSSFFGVTIDTAHVLVVDDGVTLYSGNHAGYAAGNTLSFAKQLAFNKGDTIDFVVGASPNGSNSYDYVGLNATISAASVPEPASIALLGSGLALVLFKKMRRRPAA